MATQWTRHRDENYLVFFYFFLKIILWSKWNNVMHSWVTLSGMHMAVSPLFQAMFYLAQAILLSCSAMILTEWNQSNLHIPEICVKTELSYLWITKLQWNHYLTLIVCTMNSPCHSHASTCATIRILWSRNHFSCLKNSTIPYFINSQIFESILFFYISTSWQHYPFSLIIQNRNWSYRHTYQTYLKSFLFSFQSQNTSLSYRLDRTSWSAGQSHSCL